MPIRINQTSERENISFFTPIENENSLNHFAKNVFSNLKLIINAPITKPALVATIVLLWLEDGVEGSQEMDQCIQDCNFCENMSGTLIPFLTVAEACYRCTQCVFFKT